MFKNVFLNKLFYLFALVVLCSILGCNEKSTKPNNLYYEKGQSLFDQLKIDYSNYFNEPACIISSNKFTPSDFDFQKIASLHLKIKNTKHLAFQEKMYFSAFLFESSLNNKIIITQKKLDSLENNKVPFFKWLDGYCNNTGYLLVSNPVFNEKYNQVIVNIGVVCGPLCGSGVTVYYYWNGKKWIEKEVLGFWVS